jgi:hypothetical protein
MLPAYTLNKIIYILYIIVVQYVETIGINKLARLNSFIKEHDTSIC